MRTEINIKKLVGTPLLILEIAVFLLCLIQIVLTIGYPLVGLIYGVPFAIITTILVRLIYKAMLAPCCQLRDVIIFEPERIVQQRKGKPIKELPISRELRVYRYVGILRTTLIFSARELPQGEILKTYKTDPEAIFFPYVPRRMPKLKKYYDKAKRV